MAAPTVPPSNEIEPQILRKRKTRFLILGLILAVSALALKFYFDNRSDPDFGTLDSAGMVAAIEYLPEGQQAVVFDSKGTKIGSKGYRPGSTERDIVWRPDGNRLFFVADREADKGFQVYRWMPSPSADPQVKTQGSLGKSNLSFSPTAGKNPDEPFLMTSGGFVVEYDPKTQKGHQILPPAGQVTQEGDNGEGQGSGTSQFSALYGQIGESFRQARWCHGGDAVAAVMRGEAGDTLVVQGLSSSSGRPLPPKVVVAGDRVDFDVNPQDGSVVFTVNQMRWTSRDKTPKEKRFRHVIGMYRLGDPGPVFITGSLDDKIAFGSPVVSPAGDKMLFVLGSYDTSANSLVPTELRLGPLDPGTFAANMAVVVRGAVYEPSWSPSGGEVTYVKRTPNGNRSVFVAKVDGSDERNISGESGNFGTPKFSPQTK